MPRELLRRTGMLAVAAVLAACAAPPPAPAPAPVVAPKPKTDRVTLLPQADGTPSAVVVRPTTGGSETLLSTPFATASISAASVETSVGNADQVRARYKDLYEAMPPARRSYLVYFDTGGDRLTAESAQRLNDILAEIAKLPAPEVLVIGHTDTVGSAVINDDISMQRARIVRNRLVERGIDPQRIEAVGRGWRELLVPTREGVAEARNRRVEIQVR